MEVACLASEYGAAPPKSRDLANETKRGIFHDGDHELERTDGDHELERTGQS